MTIKNLYPTIKPSLDLNFARSKALDPRVSFSRASVSGIGAAYYDGKTVAKAEENLLTWSQDFSNAVWAKVGVAISGNSAPAPDGALAASKVIALADATDHGIVQSITAGYTYAMSVYAKAAEHSKIQFYDGGFAKIKATFDLTAVTASGDIGCTASITSVGFGWYRCVAISSNTSLSSFRIKSLPSSGVTTSNFGDAYTGDGSSGAYLWGVQLEQRSSATAYTPTTSAPITNYIPALQYAAAHVPRFDHDPITGESKGLLIEEARTNLLTYSSEFDNAAWSKGSATVSANSLVAPDGSLGADMVSASASYGGVYTSFAGSAVSYTYSVFAKKGTSDSLYVKANNAGQIAYYAFNLSAGTFAASAGAGSATMVPVGNGWYRVSVTPANVASGTSFFEILSSTTGTFYIWGAQLEAGAFPTSYIPTTSAQVTRAADSASMTGANFSSWYRQDEGSLSADYSFPNGLKNNFAVPVGMGQNGNNRFILILGTAISGLQKAMVSLANTPTFAATNSGYLNGTSVGTGMYSTFADGGIVSSLAIGAANTSGGNILNGHIKRIAYYPKRLTDAQLQALTV